MRGKKPSSGVARVFGFLGPRLVQFFFGVILLSVLIAASSVAKAFLYKDAMNSISGGSFHTLYRDGILLSLVMLANFLFQPWLWTMFMSAGPRAGKDIRETAVKAVQRLPMAFFDSARSGDIVSRINADSAALVGVFDVRFRRFVTPLALAVFLSAAMLYLEWRFALILISLNALVAALNLLFAPSMKKTSMGIQGNLASLVGRVVDMLAGIACVKVFPMKERIYASFESENQALASAQMRRAVLEGALVGMNNFLGLAVNLGAAFIGMFLMSRNRINLGTLLAFISLQADIGRSFLEAAQYFPIVQKAFAGADRLFELLDRNPEEKRLTYPGEGESHLEIELRGVEFAYPKGIPIIKGIDLGIPKGKRIALVGESGGGKTTLLRLLLGFGKADAGSIFLMGRPYGSYTLEELRALVAWVPQEPYLFNGTIRENIGFGREGAKDAEINEAAERANALEFILALKDGFDSPVGQGGMGLSGGQRQRIAIARAILKDAPILLLDEGTSSLDYRSEFLVQDALKKFMAGRTSIVVAHRLTTIVDADQICVVEGGKIVERGSHQELLDLGGAYGRLWREPPGASYKFTRPGDHDLS